MPKLPPPVLPLLFLAIGAATHYTIWHVEPLPPTWNLAIGAAFLVAAASIATLAFRAFRNHGESLAIHIPTETLVSNSIYGYSRNPVYLSFLLLIVAIGCALNSAAILAATVPAFIALNWYTIPREERYLRRKLGRDYKEFSMNVRRWL